MRDSDQCVIVTQFNLQAGVACGEPGQQYKVNHWTSTRILTQPEPQNLLSSICKTTNIQYLTLKIMTQ